MRPEMLTSFQDLHGVSHMAILTDPENCQLVVEAVVGGMP